MKVRYYVVLFFYLFVSLANSEESVLYDKEITVLRGDFKEVHFLAPSEPSSVQFVGKFSTEGGFYDDLNFLILTQTEYARWYSNRSNKPLVKVEKKKSYDFKIDAKPGETYYFVMDNFFSTVSNKKVRLTIRLVSKT